LFVFARIEREQSAKAADLAEHFASVGGGEQLRERGLDPVAEIDVHARAGVRFLFHAAVS
jgi:hypothetical protein